MKALYLAIHISSLRYEELAAYALGRKHETHDTLDCFSEQCGEQLITCHIICRQPASRPVKAWNHSYKASNEIVVIAMLFARYHLGSRHIHALAYLFLERLMQFPEESWAYATYISAIAIAGWMRGGGPLWNIR